MDALGVAATSIQLVQILLQLHTCLKHQPRKLMSWGEQLSCLVRIITSVKENPKLHTKLVKTILESVVAKTKALENLLEQLSLVHQKKKFDIQKNIRKITNALTAKSNESRILKYLDDLERDKTTLMLAISTINSSNLDKSEENSESNTKSRKETENMAPIKNEHHSLWKKDQHQFVSNLSPFQLLQLSATLIASNPTSTGASDPRGNSATNVRNVIRGNKAKGNRSSLAISHPLGGTIEENHFIGNQRLDGIHEGKVMEAYVAHVQAEPMEIDEKEEGGADDPMEVDEEQKN